MKSVQVLGKLALIKFRNKNCKTWLLGAGVKIFWQKWGGGGMVGDCFYKRWNTVSMIYGFCSNNALLSASLSLAVFIFLLAWDYLRLFQIISQAVDAYESAAYPEKHEFYFVVFQTWRINYPYFIGVILSKNVGKSRSHEKRRMAI